MKLFNKTKKTNSKSEAAAKENYFSKIKFKWTFREYQKRVLDNSQKHLKDKRIHVVAAPGSGKTILGLELIRQLGQPALVLSPTIAIREQWKERFEEAYLPDGEKIDSYFSCDLKKPKLITSITYQGLYSSYRRITDATKAPVKSEEGDDEEIPQENYSGINIIELMQEKKISVLCLDEAHHLRAEWQKALYEFVQQVEHDVTIIALTATPPYDSKKHEWDKYIAMCGPIDEEIFVPELIRDKTLCPHQDYIYYNFPTENESDLIEKYNNTVAETLKEIFAEGKFLELLKNSDFYKDPEEFLDELSERTQFVKALLAFFNESKEKPDKRFIKMLERDDREYKWDLSVAELLFQHMISDDQLFSLKDRDYVKMFLSRHGLVEKKQVRLITNGELEKLIFTSLGKLNSISNIVDEEWKGLGDKIRLLILTDYIRVNSAVLGSDKEIKEMGVVPIFELLRRKNLGIKLAAISGKIVIVPNSSIKEINEIAGKDNARMKAVAIKDTEHSELKFEGTSSSQKIAVITKAFNKGVINGIVGTKSLLGEGWDSPVINTLVLASFVGSFMLSNQMRGRAIRIDKNVHDKVSNIWHLTAILPEYLRPDVGDNMPPSTDYATLARRFSGFLGLAYEHDVIESGLQRASTLEAPYNEKNINKANEKSFEMAKQREKIAERWTAALLKSTNEMLIQNEIIKPKKGFIPGFILKPTHYSTVKKLTHATMKSFKDLGLINKKARPLMEKDYANKKINVGICRCSQHEKNIFHQVIAEVFGPINEQKYILVKTKQEKPDYRLAFAVPEIFSKKKEHAEVFKGRMSRRIKYLELYFTRSGDGKKILALAKKKAYVNKNNNELQAKTKLRPK